MSLTINFVLDRAEGATSATAPLQNVKEFFECAPLSDNFYSNNSDKSEHIQFKSYFINVFEEETNFVQPDQHSLKLLQEYNKNSNSNTTTSASEETQGDKDCNWTVENYEEEIPAHGDILFHNFLKRIQMNPGQILR